MDELSGHFGSVLRMVIEGRNDGKDGSPRVGGKLHVAEVNAVEGRFADTKYQAAIFFQADIGGAMDEVGGHAVCDAGKRPHRAGKDDHGVGGVAAAGNIRADVVLGMLLNLRRWCAEELFCQIIAAT